MIEAVAYHLPSCSSTQLLAHAWIDKQVDAPAGVLIVVADSQQTGQGRAGRRWQDGPGRSFALSVAVRRNLAVSALPEAPMRRLALDAAEAIASCCGVRAVVKPPNDLVMNGRKLGGVLVDSRIRGDAVERIVAGIGINLTGPEFDVGGTAATTLEAVGGVVPAVPELAAALAQVVADAFGVGRLRVRWMDAAQRSTLIRRTLPAPSRA